MQQPLAVFLDHFSGLEDSREAGKVLHPVPEILLVTLCGVMADAEGFEDREDDGSRSWIFCVSFCLLPMASPATIRCGVFSERLIRVRLPRCLWRLRAMCFPKRPSA